jgi:hypothetical protein
MADLQCPATILLIAREAIAADGGPGLVEAGQLSGVFVASRVAADPSGLAAAVGLANHGAWRLSSLADVVDGTSLVQAMDHLADLHRGETIALVATRDMIQDALGDASVQADLVRVAIDSSGWFVSTAGG